MEKDDLLNEYQNIIIKGYEDEDGHFQPFRSGNPGGGSSVKQVFTTSATYNPLTESLTYTRNDGQTYSVSIKPLKDVLSQTIEQANAKISDLQKKDTNLQKEIDNINAQTVFDNIVGTKAELTNLTNVKDGEVAVVFSDETKNGNMSLYSFKGGKWTFLADKEPTYTKSEINALKTDLEGKITTNSGKVGTLESSIAAQDTQIADVDKKVAANTAEISKMNEKIFGIEDVTVDDSSLNPVATDYKAELSSFIVNITRQLFLNANNKLPKNFEMPFTDDFPNLKTLITKAMREMNPKFTGTAEALYILYNPYIETKADNKIYSSSGIIYLAGTNYETQTLNFNIVGDVLNVELVHSGSKGGTNVIASQVTSSDGNVQTDLDGLKSNKLNTDLGNVDDSGFNEKLQKAGVVLKTDVPKTFRGNFKAEDDVISHGEPIIIEPDATYVDITLEGVEAQDFTFQLPNFSDYQNLEKMRLKLQTTQDNGQDNQRTQYIIRTSNKVFIDGQRTKVYDNIKTAIIDLIPDREDQQWIINLVYNEEEIDKSGEITISDEYGGMETTDNIQLGRNMKITKGSHNGFVYEDESEDFISDGNITKVTEIDVNPDVLKMIAGNDGFYSTLEYPTELPQAKTKDKPTKSKVFVDYVVLDTLGGVQIDLESKTYGIQELDMLDPNVTGGEAYVVVIKLSLKGYAREDFTFKAQLNNMLTDLPITDSNGSVFEVVKNYKNGDKLGDVYLYGIDVAKGMDQIYIHTEHDNLSDSIVLNDKENGNTSVVFQELTKLNKTGKYINQFMIDNSLSLKWNHQYVGESLMNLKYLLGEDYEPTAINVGNMSIDGMTVFTNGMIKHSQKNKVFTIQSDGQPVSFGLGKVFDIEQSKELENSELNVKTTLEDPTNAVRVSLLGYKGNTLMKSNKIITGYNNDTPTMDIGWTVIQSLQINENPQGTANAYNEKLNVPSGYDNYGVFIHTAEEQEPNTISFQAFEINSELNKNVWTIIAPSTFAQMKYKYSTDTMVLDETCPTNYRSLRYTINSKPTPVPIGVIKSGNAMLKKVKNWTDSGYEGEGGLEALTDMILTVNYQTYVNTLRIGEDAKNNQTISFYMVKNQADWKNPTVGNADETNMLVFNPKNRSLDLDFTATMNVQKGDVISCYMSSNVDDGAYLQAETGQRIYEVVATAKEVIKK